MESLARRQKCCQARRSFIQSLIHFRPQLREFGICNWPLGGRPWNAKLAWLAAFLSRRRASVIVNVAVWRESWDGVMGTKGPQLQKLHARLNEGCPCTFFEGMRILSAHPSLNSRRAACPVFFQAGKRFFWALPLCLFLSLGQGSAPIINCWTLNDAAELTILLRL